MYGLEWLLTKVASQKKRIFFFQKIMKDKEKQAKSKLWKVW